MSYLVNYCLVIYYVFDPDLYNIHFTNRRMPLEVLARADFKDKKKKASEYPQVHSVNERRRYLYVFTTRCQHCIGDIF